MIEIIPARPEMADVMRVQNAQRVSGMQMTRESLAQCIAAGPAFACVDGSILAIGGINPVWHQRAVAWGLLSDSIGASMTPVHRAVLRGLDGLFVTKRVEAYVALDHAEGFRWMRLLGFQQEGMMRCFHEGQDFALFSRIRR